MSLTTTKLDYWHVGLPEREAQLRKGFAPSVALLSTVILGLFFGLERYTELSGDAVEQVDRFYMYFIHVQIMVFVGFGFLMTFMRRYSHSAVALNYLASALVMLEAILVIGATQQVFWNHKRSKIQIDLPLLIDASFCAASGMIAFGAFIGKATPTQTLWLLVLQVPLYALNQHLVVYTFRALDMGGTIVIHLFGAYYGLAASLVLSRRQPLHGLSNPKNCGSQMNDLFAMIGTLFLFIYWPSFNGAMASVSAGDLALATDAQKLAQFLAIVNTLLSLLGAVLAVFGTSALMGGRFDMVHVQNSTLAGGVAMGAACTLRMTPGGSLAVGLGAGLISTLGFMYLTPLLDRTIGLGDTCGVHNLHGIPAVLGALAAGLAALGQHPDYLQHADGATQLGYQVLAAVVTVGIAAGGGLLAGWAVAVVDPLRSEPMMAPELFDDGPWWHGQHVEPLMAAGSTHPGTISPHGLPQREGTTHRTHRSNNASVHRTLQPPQPALSPEPGSLPPGHPSLAAQHPEGHLAITMAPAATPSPPPAARVARASTGGCSGHSAGGGGGWGGAGAGGAGRGTPLFLYGGMVDDAPTAPVRPLGGGGGGGVATPARVRQ